MKLSSSQMMRLSFSGSPRIARSISARYDGLRLHACFRAQVLEEGCEERRLGYHTLT